MQTNKYLIYAVTGGLFLTLFVPFVITANSFFPFITGKNFAFRIIVELTFGLWLILALRDATYRPKFSWILGAFAVFLGVLGVADVMSPNVLKSLWSNFERMEGYVTLLHLFAYFIVASSTLTTQRLWTRMFQTSVVASVVMSGYGILQLLGYININQGGVRLDGTLGNAAYLGAYMMFHIFVTLFLLVRQWRSIVARTLYFIAIALQLFALYHTATRGAIVGLVGGVVITSLLVILFSKAWTFGRKISAVTLLCTIVVVGGIYLLKSSEFVRSNPTLTRLASISTSEAGPRFMVWNMAWQGFKEKPIFGWGQESFNYVFNKYYDPGMYAQEQWFDRTHNVLFDWLIAGGALGLLSYLFIFGFALVYIWKQGEIGLSTKRCIERFVTFWKRASSFQYLEEKAVLTGLLGAYFIQNLFVFDNITSYLLFMMVIAYIHSISAYPTRLLSKGWDSLDSGTVNRVLVPIVSVLTVFMVYSVNVDAVRASRSLIDALRPQEAGVSENLKYFKQTLAYDTFGNAEAREQLVQATMQVLSSQSVDLALKEDFYNTTVREMQAQIEKIPDDARYQLFLGSFLNRIRNYDGALPYLEKAVELSPKKQTILFELGSLYINKGDYKKALSIMKEAFDLEPNFKEARVIYAVAGIYAKEDTLVTELLAPLEGTSFIYDDRIVQAYANVGNRNMVVQLLTKKVIANPNDTQAIRSLAAAYLDLGERSKSIELLEKIIEIDPSSKSIMETFIREIRAGRNP